VASSFGSYWNSYLLVFGGNSSAFDSLASSFGFPTTDENCAHNISRHVPANNSLEIMKTSVYLTFKGNCAAAFDFYKAVFGVKDFSMRMTVAELSSMGVNPPKDVPNDRIAHISMPVGDMELMGCDYDLTGVIEKQPVARGGNMQISLMVDTPDEADRLYKLLSADGGLADFPMRVMFWDAYFGFLTDRFGIQWMLDTPSTKNKTEEQVKKERINATVTRMNVSMKHAMDDMKQLEQLVAEEPQSKKSKP
jgi:PhnB protein